jgi:hypothetical protein
MLVLLAICDASRGTIFHIHALASHLDTLDAPREGRDVGAKAEDGV